MWETIEAKRGSEMSEIDSGGTIFPTKYGTGDVGFHSLGLTKREWFAAMALQGLISAKLDTIHADTPNHVADAHVKLAHIFADSMIRAGKGEK